MLGFNLQPAEKRMDSLDNDQYEAHTSPAAEPTSIELWGSGLLSLPNELLLSIFDELGTTDLYHLALISRRLNHTALHIYFSRRGCIISPSGVLKLERETMDELPALRAALFITSIKHVSWTFDYHPDKLIRDVRDLHALLSRVSVEEVMLSFLLVDKRISMRPFPHLKGKVVWKDGIDALQALFSLIIGKARAFTIRGGKHFVWSLGPVIPKEVAVVRPEKPLARLSAAFKNRFGAPNKPAKASSQDLIGPCHKPLRRTKVESLEVHSSMLLSPPFRDWTVETINASPISNLSFVYELGQCWSELLPKVNVPTVSQLSLKACPMKLADLSLFMSRHPGMTTLNLYDDQLHICDSHEAISFFPHVTTLTATPDYTRLLLVPEGSFCNLRFLTILSTVLGMERFSFSRLDSYLAPIGHRVKGIVLTLNLYLAASLNPYWRGVDVDEEEGPPRVLHCASNLELSWWRFDDIPDITRLNALLSRFPVLKHLSIAQTNPPLIAGRTPMMNVVDLINDACPWIKSMSLNGEYYHTVSS